MGKSIERDEAAPWTIVVIFSLFYIFGELLQYSEIGPNWLRWYMSDFGFSACICSSIYTFSRKRVGLEVGLFAGAFIGLIYELLQFYQDCGDIIDMLMIGGGAFICLILVTLSRRHLIFGEEM